MNTIYKKRKNLTTSWTTHMLVILHKYYFTSNPPGKLNLIQKNAFVKEMKQAYDEATILEKTDVLVPKDGSFLSDYAIKCDMAASGKERYSLYYNMPENDGFLKSEPIIPTTLVYGELYDRLGSPTGRFTSELINDKPQELSSRSLPYYIPEEDISKSPAYHIYRVLKPYSGVVAVPPEATNALLRKGIVAPAFNEKGLGTQTVIPKGDNIKNLIERGILHEV